MNKRVMSDLTIEELKDELHYNPETGYFTSLKRRGKREIGDIAGMMSYKGYIGIKVFGLRYSAHRLAWFYTYGVWPEEQIDHINGVRDDNRLENLRLANSFENMANRKIGANNTTGVKGVTYAKDDRRNRRYRAQINVNKVVHKQDFYTLEEAEEWLRVKRIELHGEYARFE